MKFFYILIVTVLLAAVAPAQHVYSFTNLPSSQQLGFFSAVAVNNSGVIAGNFSQHAGYWSGGMYTILPDLGFGAIARSINGQGDIVGTVHLAGGQNEAALWRGGILNLLGRQNGFNTEAMAINASGHVLIQSAESNNSIGYFYDGATFRDIVLPGYGYLTDLNDNDVACGWSTGVPLGDSGGIIWINNAVVSLGPCNNDPFQALSLNNYETIAGYAGLESYRWEDGVFDYVAGYPDMVRAINDAGDIVGEIGVGSDLAVIWVDGHTRHVLADLTSLPPNLKLERAVGISNTGLITGIAYSTDGSGNSSFLLTPVPEPTTIAVLGIGLLSAIKKRRRSK